MNDAPPERAWSVKKAMSFVTPLPGLPKISQSRSWPHPPIDTQPVPMPPMGMATASSSRPSYTRIPCAASRFMIAIIGAGSHGVKVDRHGGRTGALAVRARHGL